MTTPSEAPETLGEKFSAVFQRQVLALMYCDPAFLKAMAGTLQPDHFDDRIDAAYAQIFLDFAHKFPTDRVTKEVVFNEIAKLIRSKRVEESEKPLYVKAFIEIATPPSAPGYIRDEMKQFILAKSMEVELVGSVDLLKRGHYKEIVDRLMKAYTKADTPEKAADVKVIGSVAERVETLKDPEASLKKDGISTGLPGLDAVLYRHGIGPGEMIVICGSPGRGKSIWLSSLAMAAVLKGHQVVYYTLEMSANIVMRRFDAMMTGIPFVDLIRYADAVEKRWEILRKSFRLGEIHLHDLPPRSLTPNMIRRHLAEYHEQGIFPTYLVVDYADIMSSDKKIDERRLEHGDVYEQLRSVAKEFGIAVATASQANRDSLNKREVDLDSLAEDFSKAMTADYVIGLSQTKSDLGVRSSTGKGTGNMAAFIAKNRNGVKGASVATLTDFCKMRISLTDGENFDREHFGSVIY